MRSDEKDTLALLRRSHDFLVDAELEGPLAPEAEQVKALAVLADRLAAHGVAQEESIRQRRVAVDTRQELVRQLRQGFVVPLARMGRRLFAAQLSDPAIAAALSVPKVGADPFVLVASAHALANTLQPHAERFVAAGFPSDVITQLRTLADRVTTAADDRRSKMKDLSAATAAAGATAREGFQLVRAIDPLVREALRADAERLAAWESLRRIPKRRKRKHETAAATAPGVSPQPIAPEVSVTSAA